MPVPAAAGHVVRRVGRGLGPGVAVAVGANVALGITGVWTVGVGMGAGALEARPQAVRTNIVDKVSISRRSRIKLASLR